MKFNLLPMYRQELLAELAERYAEPGYSTAKALSYPIIADESWFDPFLNDDAVLRAYPFNLGLWAHQLHDEICKTLKVQYVRLNLVFTYTVDDKYYRGIIAYDTPLRTDISVRVTEQRHLKIKPDTVTLASIHDNTEFAVWRPEADIQGSGKWRWMIQKELSTRVFRPHYMYCPVILGDFPAAVEKMLLSELREFVKFACGKPEHPELKKVEDNLSKYAQHMRNRIITFGLKTAYTPTALALSFVKLSRAAASARSELENGITTPKMFDEHISAELDELYDTLVEYTPISQNGERK